MRFASTGIKTFLFLSVFFFSLSVSALEVIHDSLGRRLEFARPATRIVSISPSCTEILFAIDAGDSLVAVTSFCDYPPEARQKPKIGGFSGNSVSIELIVSLKPDLVIVEEQMHQKIMGMIEKTGISCYAAGAGSFTGLYSLVDDLARITGKSAEGKKLNSSLQKRLDTVSSRLSAIKTRPAVLWLVWDQPLMTVGGSTFISEAIRVAGGKSIYDDTDQQYPQISLESVISRDPDWILSDSEQGKTLNAETLSKRQGWRSLRSVQKGNVAMVDADSINRAGPRLVDAVESLARILHPEMVP